MLSIASYTFSAKLTMLAITMFEDTFADSEDQLEFAIDAKRS